MLAPEGDEFKLKINKNIYKLETKKLYSNFNVVRKRRMIYARALG